MHIQACGGGGLVSFPSWLLKPAPCNSSPHNSLLCPAAVVFLRAAVAIPISGHISSTTHPSLAPGASALPPYPRAPTEAISISLAEQGLASSGLWSYSTGLGAGLIRLWNSTETKGISSAERKACRRAVRIGILPTTHEWKKENGNLFNEPVCFVI